MPKEGVARPATNQHDGVDWGVGQTHGHGAAGVWIASEEHSSHAVGVATKEREHLLAGDFQFAACWGATDVDFCLPINFWKSQTEWTMMDQALTGPSFSCCVLNTSCASNSSSITAHCNVGASSSCSLFFVSSGSS